MRRIDDEMQMIREDVSTKEDIKRKLKEEWKKEAEKREAEYRRNQPMAVPSTSVGKDGQPVSPGTQWRQTVQSVSQKIKDKEARRKNIVIYNMEEPNTNLKEERIRKD